MSNTFRRICFFIEIVLRRHSVDGLGRHSLAEGAEAPGGVDVIAGVVVELHITPRQAHRFGEVVDGDGGRDARSGPRDGPG
ncbi:MAG: hypothetical protein JOY92_17175 [Verrucomicrobia bacterium]|nr:hypothetical protein [Verrucomicrobiota bacterium]